MEDIVIEFEIDNARMISVNDQYYHPVRKTKKGRYVSYFAKSDSLKKVQAFYEDKLKEAITDEQVETIKNYLNQEGSGVGLSLEIIIGVPSYGTKNDKSLYEVDVTNYIKAYEDCIVKRTGIDDSRHYKVSSEKRIYDTEEYKWIVYTKIRPYELIKYSGGIKK